MKSSPAQPLRVACGNKMLEPGFHEHCLKQLSYACSPFEIIKTRDSSDPVGDHWVNKIFYKLSCLLQRKRIKNCAIFLVSWDGLSVRNRHMCLF